MAEVRPFANYAEYDAWAHVNCENCATTDCEIDLALAFACYTGGTIPLPLAERMGDGQRCKEFVPTVPTCRL